MFKSSYAELEPDRLFGTGFALSENRKQPAGQLAATVVVNPAIGLAESLGRYHYFAPDQYCLKAETARALANELLVLRHIYKLARHTLSCKIPKRRGLQ